MNKDFNFRRPVNIAFGILALVFCTVYAITAVVQLINSNEAYKQQNKIYAQGVAANYAAYLDGYENIIRETAHAIEKRDKGKITQDDKAEFRAWLIDRLRVMPDVSSIIYADYNGRYVRVPYLEHPQVERWDPRKEHWFSVEAEDSDSALYSITADHFSGMERTITLSYPVMNQEDGSISGVLAFNVDIDKSVALLGMAHPPIKSKNYITTSRGKVIISPDETVTKEEYRIIERVPETNGNEIHSEERGKYYSFNPIGHLNWLFVQEIDESEIHAAAVHSLLNMAYSMVLILFALFFCWLYLHSALNNVFMRIANSIRSGEVKTTGAAELLHEEICRSRQRLEVIAADAMTDPLTGLANRRAFEHEAEYRRHPTGSLLAMIDIDNFKRINDTWGHVSGDNVLKTVAELGLRLRGLENITLYRFGGEEIAVIFHSVPVQEALDFLNKWRKTLYARPFREKGLQVSFSAGLCQMDGAPLTDIVARADSLLYEAKARGKNQVVSGVVGEEQLKEGV
ncbi:TPA: diguanylate cyclase [Enterobacter ludwigii]